MQLSLLCWVIKRAQTVGAISRAEERAVTLSRVCNCLEICWGEDYHAPGLGNGLRHPQWLVPHQLLIALLTYHSFT